MSNFVLCFFLRSVYDRDDDIYCYMYLVADILTEHLRKWCLRCPLPNILFLCKPLDLISCHGLEWGNVSNTTSSEVI